MSLIPSGSQVKFHTVKPIQSLDGDPHKTRFLTVFLSGTVQADDGTRVTVWTDDARTFHVPHEYITEINDPDAFVPPPTISFDELISQGR